MTSQGTFKHGVLRIFHIGKSGSFVQSSKVACSLGTMLQSEIRFLAAAARNSLWGAFATGLNSSLILLWCCLRHDKSDLKKFAPYTEVKLGQFCWKRAIFAQNHPIQPTLSGCVLQTFQGVQFAIWLSQWTVKTLCISGPEAQISGIFASYLGGQAGVTVSHPKLQGSLAENFTGVTTHFFGPENCGMLLCRPCSSYVAVALTAGSKFRI